MSRGRHAPLDPNFWGDVAVGAPDECWPWRRYCSPLGYGRLIWRGKSTGAYRVAYELAHGPIPSGLEVCHSCDVPSCCNPAHLFLGTHAENMHDREIKGRGRYGTQVTPEVARTIRAEFARGVMQKELAARYGLKQPAISHIVNGKRWKEV